MILLINDIEKKIPFELAEITLGQFIEYYDRYGRDLDSKLDELIGKVYENEDEKEFNQELNINTHIDEECIAWVSFWTGFSFEDIKDKPDILPVLTEYRKFRQQLKQSEDASNTYPSIIEWEGCQWEIQDYALTPSNGMTFNEVITSKEVIRQVHALGKKKWDALPYLCAIFLRKTGEPFNDEFVQDGSERLKIMQSLPMSHAIQVAFFLSSCVSTWMDISQYLKEEAVTESQNSQHTLKSGVG